MVGGIAIGLAVGFVLRQFRRRLNHSPTEIAIALLSGYFAYLPAQAAGVSAVLAVVTVGVYVGWYTPELTTVQTRLQGDAVWEILTFLLNALLFGLVGLQLRPILDSLARPLDGCADRRRRDRQRGGDRHAPHLDLSRRPTSRAALSKRIRERDPYPPWQYPALIGWAGLRGAVSLAAALALPLTIDSRRRRSRSASFVIYLAFCVILATLVLQGLTLPAVIRVLRPRGRRHRRRRRRRRRASTPPRPRSGGSRSSPGEDWVREDTAERMRGAYRFRASRFAARFDDEDDGEIEERSQNYQRLRRELLDAERNAVVELRRQGRINDAVMNRVQRDLDLEDARLDV